MKKAFLWILMVILFTLLLVGGTIGVFYWKAASASLPEDEALMKANEVIRRGMNVRDLEAHLKKERMAARKAAERKANPSEELWGNKELREMQLALQEELGRRVTINRKGMGGILTIEYSDMDDLTDLVDKLTGGD